MDNFKCRRSVAYVDLLELLIVFSVAAGVVHFRHASQARADDFVLPARQTLRPVAVRPTVSAGRSIDVKPSENLPGDTQPTAIATEPASTGAQTDLDQLLDKPLEELTRTDVKVPALDMPVSTVDRSNSTVGKSPAAVFVITPEMIRRSGARNVPEALRMAPGVEVAKFDSNKYAISIRGFNGIFANKLLVQIDGRRVYTQLYAGVYWDVQEVLLEDVERIEVIRGPGAVIWGANAVNGVINILTKSAKDTQGSLVQGGVGTYERGFGAARQGGKAGENLYYRAYAQGFDRGAGFSPDGDAFENDQWRQTQGGFRMDWTPDKQNTVTLQGDVYEGTSGGTYTLPTFVPPFRLTGPDDVEVAGGNVLYRWSFEQDDQTGYSVQAYFDETRRAAKNYSEDRHVFDLDLLYRFSPAERHQLVSGFEYQANTDQIEFDGFKFAFENPDRETDLFSYFVQDEITLRDELLYLTLGAKFVHNDFTNFEYQPSVRMLWTPTERDAIWGGVSRAVRLPSRAEQDIRLRLLPVAPNVPVFGLVEGNPDLLSEQLLAYELGWRQQTTDAFSWDLAVFFNQYDDLVFYPAAGPPVPSPPGLIVPFRAVNNGRGDGYGFELAVNYQVNPCWKLYGAYSYLQLFLSDDRSNTDAALAEGLDPANQVYAMSSWDVGRDWKFDLIGRYVDELRARQVPHYTTMDARLAWEPRKNFELAIVGQNLLDSHILQFNPITRALGETPTEVPRGVYTMLTWRF